MAGGAIWILVVFGGIYGGLKIASKMNSGWTQEKQKAILNNVDNVKFKKLCYLEGVMKKFPDPADYNKLNDKQKEEFNESMEVDCLTCDPNFEEKATQKVPGLPDDF